MINILSILAEPEVPDPHEQVHAALVSAAEGLYSYHFRLSAYFFITWWRFGCNDDPYWMICLIIVVSLCHFTSCQRDCRETKEEVQRYVVFLNIGSMSPCTWCMGMDSLSQPIASSWCFLVLIFADSSVDVNDDDCVDCDDDLPSKRQHAGE